MAFKGVAQAKYSVQVLSVQKTGNLYKAKHEMQLDSLKRQITRLKEQQQTGALLAAMQRFSRLCDKMGRYDAFLQNAREMEALAHSEKNRFMEAFACINIGIDLTRKNQLDSASYYEYKALKIGVALNHDSLQAEAFACLSGVHNYRMDYQTSLQFCDRALEHAIKWRTSKELLVVCLGCKASTLYRMHRYPEAIRAGKRALPLAEAIHHHDYITFLKMNLANNYVALHQNDSARRFLKELERDMSLYDLSPFYFTNTMVMLGMVYWDMRDDKKAFSLLQQQLPVVKELNYTNVLLRIYDTLSAIAESEHRYQVALTYKKSFQEYQATMQKQNNDHLLSELEIRYQTAEKERALSQKDLQLQTNRYYMYYTFSALAVSLLIVALLVVHNRYKRRIHRNELQAIQQEKEIQLLQALMQGEEKERSRIAKDLHDGVAGMLAAVKMHFSSLPEADDLLLTEGYRQGMKLLNEATQEIRKTSHNLMPEVLLQHGLDEAIRRYCNNINNSKTLQIQYDSWGEIDRFVDSFELSVYRIVQELLNNILKHSKATQAMIQVTQQEDVLSISIEDNGVGFAKPTDTEGMGLRSLQSRIQAMNGKMEMQASEQSGVSAYLEFEIAELKKDIAVQYA